MVLNAKSSNINIIWECAGNENFQAPTKSTESETLWGLFLFWGGVVCTNFLFNGKVHLLSIRIIYYLALVLVSLEVRIIHGYEEFK